MESKLVSRCISPPEYISKQICFIMNNLTEYNLKSQVDEITTIIPYYFTQWLAYSIINRIASEPSQHNVYYKFITMISEHYTNFETMMLEILTKEIDYLLKLPNLNVSNGKILKYFGGFLGRLTMAYDIPIQLDIKSLIYTTFKDKPNLLDYIISFISELLKNIKYSKRIKLSNPWVTEILQVIKELHHITDKLNVQFEIELLFNFLECDFNEWKSTYYLRRCIEKK
ncbi:unnamed protein product [Schistosoma rodhaini]|uniref:CNOT1_CAF1_bind domain-containing protein n=1 Tax=Schistosoma rodhaini TaxID=6188 RepID=A0AA85FK46_9TREM|nr:unnamed protein product [Schistosoma rodhaini]